MYHQFVTQNRDCKTIFYSEHDLRVFKIKLFGFELDRGDHIRLTIFFEFGKKLSLLVR